MNHKQAKELEEKLGIRLPRRSGKGKRPGEQFRNGPSSTGDGRSNKDLLMAKLCEAHGIEPPVGEYPFAKDIGRKWAFDWLFDGWLALEVQGGNFVGGRHVRGDTLRDEYEKIMEAAARGYCVVYCLPEDLESGEVFPKLRRILEGRDEH